MLGDLLIRQGYPPKLHLGNGVGTCRRHRRTAHVRSNSTKNSSDERLESALAALDAFFPTPTPPPAEGTCSSWKARATFSLVCKYSVSISKIFVLPCSEQR